MSDQQFPKIELVEMPFFCFACKDVRANALTAERDALKAERRELIGVVTRLFKTAEAQRRQEMEPETPAMGRMDAYAKVLRLLESDVLEIEHESEG